MEVFLTTRDVARLLGIHPFTVGRHIDRGLLKAFRTGGGHRRVRPADFRRYLLERGIPVPPGLEAGGRLKLLVVDDEQQALIAILRAFKPLAAEVELVTTASGIEALLLLGNMRPDGMLLDIQMPGLDGFELCRRVAEHPTLKDTRVVAMTSVLKSDVLGSALTAGAVACLEKPVSAAEVLRLIRPKPATLRQARAAVIRSR